MRRIPALVLLAVLGTALLSSAARVEPPDRVVAVTIDDLPATAVSTTSDWASITERLHAVLRQRAVTATGFVNEGKLHVNGALDSSRVNLLVSWLAAGHELGNHTFAHRGAHSTPLAEYLDGIERGEVVTRALAARAGRPFRYFRHPQLHAGRSLEYRRAVEMSWLIRWAETRGVEIPKEPREDPYIQQLVASRP
jgi:peptidoglycan/xylan/chitin deacetylase (PgdA/CDA1 family)